MPTKIRHYSDYTKCYARFSSYDLHNGGLNKRSDISIVSLNFASKTNNRFIAMVRRIIGREAEMAELRRCMESDRSEFVIVYGRRRVGKTFLIDCFFEGHYDFSFVGRNNATKDKQHWVMNAELR